MNGPSAHSARGAWESKKGRSPKTLAKILTTPHSCPRTHNQPAQRRRRLARQASLLFLLRGLGCVSSSPPKQSEVSRSYASRAAPRDPSPSPAPRASFCRPKMPKCSQHRGYGKTSVPPRRPFEKERLDQVCCLPQAAPARARGGGGAEPCMAPRASARAPPAPSRPARCAPLAGDEAAGRVRPALQARDLAGAGAWRAVRRVRRGGGLRGGGAAATPLTSRLAAPPLCCAPALRSWRWPRRARRRGVC